MDHSKKLLASISHEFAEKCNACSYNQCYFGKETIKIPKIDFGYSVSLSFAKDSIETFKENDILSHIDMRECEIHDKDAAAIVRSYCRTVASHLSVKILPVLVEMPIDLFSFTIFYNGSTSEIKCVRRLYCVSIFMDRFNWTRMSSINEENVSDYFEKETSQIEGLFHRWASRYEKMPDSKII